MRSSLLILILFVAQIAKSEIILSAGFNNVIEREAYASQFTNRTPFVLRAGYLALSNSVFAEYNQFTTTDAVSQIQVSRTQREFLVWARHSFWQENIFQTYVQAAPGVQLESIKTTFMNQTHDDTSKPYLALAVAGGLGLQYESFRFEVEFRALSSSQASPNPTYSVGFYGGYVF